MNKTRYYNFVGELLGEDGDVLCDEPRFVDIQSYEALERRTLGAERVLEEAAEQMRGMVARSRLDAVEGELTAAQEKLAKVQRDAGAEIERLQSLVSESANELHELRGKIAQGAVIVRRSDMFDGTDDFESVFYDLIELLWPGQMVCGTCDGTGEATLSNVGVGGGSFKAPCPDCGPAEPQGTREERGEIGLASDALCEDCPPSDYPTDETRCLPCPRRAHGEVV